MSFVLFLFNRLFPTEILTHHLSDLNNYLLGTKNKYGGICLSIEKKNKSRQYCCLTIDQITKLYDHCPVLERTLYESISSDKLVKAFIDFEYYRDNNSDIKDHTIGPNCCLKILYYLLNNDENNIDIIKNLSENILEQFLVLEA